MIKAKYTDKPLVTAMLTKAFNTTESINYIIKQDKKRVTRITRLMEYLFEISYLFGDIFLSDNKKACALILFPDKQKTTLRTMFLDAKLILTCLGLTNMKRVLVRKSKLKNIYPKKPIYCIWFLGVDPAHCSQGIGSTLLEDIIKDSIHRQRPIYLETSTQENVPWYQKYGFTIYHELDLNYKLFCLKKELHTDI